MPIKISCACGGSFRVPDHAAGKKATCPKCGARLIIPLSEQHEDPADKASSTNAPAVVPRMPLATAPLQAVPVPAEVYSECPFCSEQVLARAKKCKHCGEMLEESGQMTQLWRHAIQSEATTAPEVRYELLGRKSWTAYIAPGILACMLALVTIPVVVFFGRVFLLPLVLIDVLFVALRIFNLISYRLYLDSTGVWVYSGILPWTKGVTGVKWRDLDEAVYFSTLWSWLFGSYTIRVSHRFTKDSELIFTHLHRGQQAVKRINEVHQLLIDRNRVQ